MKNLNKKINFLFIASILFLVFVIINNTTKEPKKQEIKVPQKNIPKTITSPEQNILLPFEKKIPTANFTKIFVPVTSFSSPNENISSNELKNIFLNNQNQFQNIYILKENEIELKEYFGSLNHATQLDSLSELLVKITNEDIAIIPFDKISPQFKTMKVDDQDIFDKNLKNNNLKYPKIVIQQKTFDSFSESNRNEKNISRAFFTGVTAISRTVQKYINLKNDPLFPARSVMDKLQKADLTHVSSENPFFDECPENPADTLILCGKTPSIESLKSIGTDVIDLGGNHQNDFGPNKFLESIIHLKNAGFEYFGGGTNEEDAAKILYKTIGNTKIAFLSYAYFDSLNGKFYRNIANGERPGVNFYEEQKLKNNIDEAQKNADFVIVDYQFTESYNYNPLPEQTTVFRKTIDFGADLVLGVQSHQPQKIEFYNNGLIFYGLGNFFFDQMWSEPTRQGIIPHLSFYDGKLINIEILTTLLYDYSQPRFVEGEEREKILSNILP